MLKKKWISMCMVIIIAAMSLLGCSNGGDSGKTENVSETAESDEVQEAAQESIDSTEEVVIYLTRHGKTLFNTIGLMQGWCDSPLTEEGVEVAKRLGKGLEDIEFSSVYASDLTRAYETAEYVIGQNNVKADIEIKRIKGLRETNYGTLEGADNNETMEMVLENKNISMEELYAREDALELLADAVAEMDESGQAENYEKMLDRVTTAFDEVVKDSLDNGGGNILVVSHGNAIMAILNSLGNPGIADIDNASVTKIIYSNGAYTIESVGDMSYVESE